MNLSEQQDKEPVEMTNTRRRCQSSSFRCRRQKRVLAVLAPPCVPSWSLRRRQVHQSRVVFGEHIELPTRRREEVVRVRCVAYINITATPHTPPQVSSAGRTSSQLSASWHMMAAFMIAFWPACGFGVFFLFLG
ncbi:hypothetical protein Zmor_014235 [Zophobas morio]|uniref:Uncharacterized protein n=1 Tax=Zophobas morio TaxID=2755281 RepID=A0AA38IBW3_9CUCU|nr:hypothetical protein Zmor_014235 [Zophobas morio]